MAFSPDGQSLLTSASDERLLAWDLSSLKYRLVLDAESSVSHLRFGAENSLWFTGVGGELFTTDWTEAAPRATAVGRRFFLTRAFTLSAKGDHLYTVRGRGLGEDGQLIDSYSLDGDEAETHDFEPGGRSEQVNVSPGGKLLVISSIIKVDDPTDKKRRLAQYRYDIVQGKDGKSVTKLIGDVHLYSAFDATPAAWYTPDGTRLLYHRSPTRWAIWDFARQADVAHFDAPADAITVAYEPKAGVVAAAMPDRRVLLWRAQDGQPLAVLTGAEGVGEKYSRLSRLAISPDGRLVSGTVKDKVLLWSLPESLKLTPAADVKASPTPPDTQPADSAPAPAAPDRGPFASPDNAPLPADKDDPNSTVRYRPAKGFRLKGDKLSVLSFTPDGKGVLASPDIGDTMQIDIATGARVEVKRGGGGTLRLLPLPQNSYLTLTFSYQEPVGVIDADGNLTKLEGSEGLTAYCHYPQAKLLLTGHRGGKVMVWSEDGKTLVKSFTLASRSPEPRRGLPTILSLALSPDGTRIAVGATDELSKDEEEPPRTLYAAWDMKTEKKLAEVLGGWSSSSDVTRGLFVAAVGFADDGKTLIYRQNDKHFTALPLEGPVQVHTFGQINQGMSLAAVSPDGSIVAAVATREERFEATAGISLWDTRTGKRFATLEGIDNDAKLARLSFSPDGRQLTASSGKHVLIWQVPATPR
jgi:WD40 repeat protein